MTAYAGIDYTPLPDHIREGFRSYIEEGRPPGGFVWAVLENNLVLAFAQADETNMARMFDIVSFLYNEAPSSCWGTPKKVQDWVEAHKKVTKPAVPQG